MPIRCQESLVKIVVFGASGATGRELVRQAAASGHEILAFVRGPSASADPAVRVMRGDIVDERGVRRALRGQDAAISAVGAPTPFQPYPAFREGIRNILAGFDDAASRRFVYLSFVGVPESRDQFGFIGRHLIAPRVLRHATEGHRVNEELIKASDTDWTIVRAPKLTNGPRTSSYRVGAHLEPRGIVPTLARADVAELILRQLSDAAHVRGCVTVMH
jgi:putative NADH-flavin reductase